MIRDINRKWLLILEVVRQVNEEKYAHHVGRVIFQKICYVLTRSGIETGFTFTKGSYGPYSSDIKDAITSLTNAHLMTEVHINGSDIIETHVTEDFVFNSSLYSNSELRILDRTVDLFCRMKNTEQAEIMAIILFSYDVLKAESAIVTEDDVLSYVLDWKKHWITKEDTIKDAIRSLLIFGWIHPRMTFILEDEY